MKTIKARNVNEMYLKATTFLRTNGTRVESRNGTAYTVEHPVCFHYTHPKERVLLIQDRKENPVFHLTEALWMIAGRKDLKPILPFVKSFVNYSDDGGKTQSGAYGYRWRSHFNIDQIVRAVHALKKNPLDRRVTISMFDPSFDNEMIDKGGKDIPCNLIALPRLVRGEKGLRLDLTVYNRSNDLIWGALGANAFHFSVLQELLAVGLGVEVGHYYQITNNLHVYANTLHHTYHNKVLMPQNRPAKNVLYYPQGDSYYRYYGIFDIDSLLEESGNLSWGTDFEKALNYFTEDVNSILNCEPLKTRFTDVTTFPFLKEVFQRIHDAAYESINWPITADLYPISRIRNLDYRYATLEYFKNYHREVYDRCVEKGSSISMENPFGYEGE